ncbi:glycosyl hydrolase family 2 [Maribellus sp. CM-23]|uniref:glycoside hydrolase family 2 TIM barrel-domain containing protein n=1 Tax=Maribellus sp. CM-23 TaxID=2781026 RepID=UPI001F39CA1D|nr:glycoside hydrolase family 2 TIM barrel-domain containing protein [Maribellus sp. CM-23]MCE4565897.1 glycosyl hydrolase family 2 [Maribellus sp. CM-23]
MKTIISIVIMCCSVLGVEAQNISRSFEMRYFTNDSKANGETDFLGETEWMTTDQRIDFLKEYAKVASNFFDNPGLDKQIVTDAEINDLLDKIKPQPLTSVRKTLRLDNWKAYGYRKGQDVEKQRSLQEWNSSNGSSVSDGALMIENSTITRVIDSLSWRFNVEASIKIEKGSSCRIDFLDRNNKAIVFGLNGNKLIYGSENKIRELEDANSNEWVKLKIEGDLTQKRFNLYVNDQRIQYYIPVMDTSVDVITQFSIESKGTSFIDDLFIFNHTPTDQVRYPYVSEVVLDENFQGKPNVADWYNFDFDDKHWKTVKLPSVHGGLREKEEAYFLRKKVETGDFQRAVLKLETLDPGGEVWVNGQVVGVVADRHPVELDITRQLKKNSENIIAVKVNPYKMNYPMVHSPTDHYIGWFLGRTTLELSHRCKITDVLVHTKEIGGKATQVHRVNIHYPTRDYFEGSVEINYYPWFPEEGDKVATVSRKLSIPARIQNEYTIECEIPSPKLWSFDNPSLYKVEVILRDTLGNAVDDFVTTTGIRTLEQKNSDFYVNNKPEMLNGAQIMGFRAPIETTAKYNRCAPWETVAEELLMLKKMDANLLRLHVHAEKDTVDGINDPRFAEFGDQMGIMFIWQTAAFIREGEAWNVDFDGFPKYIKQVYNHPSIVMWEASNHPNKFHNHDISATHGYVEKIYHTIYSTDQSRIISPTSAWNLTHYGNTEGTIDHKGNPITAVPEYTAHRVTRGNQDAYTGYGKKWTELRKAPYKWAASCLKDSARAYFNFEHEESVGQPNWELCKGKPWYLLQSYEYYYNAQSVGRHLTADEWRESQAWQAFSAWESMKKQMLLGYDGFSWCCLRGGANMGTYKKPLIDNLRHPKLAYYTNKMVFQRTWAGSDNVDVVYGPKDKISPVIHHLGGATKVNLSVLLKNREDKTIDKRIYKDIELEEGRTVKKLDSFRFKNVPEAIYTIEYEMNEIR